MKNRIMFSTIALGLLACALSCSSPESQPVFDAANVESELQAFQDAHREAVDSKNFEEVLQFYASDLITVNQGEPIQYGKDWIRPLMEELYQNYEFQEDFKLDNIKILGDRVAATYTYSQQMTPLNGGSSILQTGKGMCILKKSDTGNWQFEWNSYFLDEMQSGDKN